MTIDVNAETLFPLSEINNYWRGKPLHLNTWRRLHVKGITVPGHKERVRLEVIHLAGTLYCSIESLDRFIVAQNARPSSPSSPQQRARKSAAARCELEAMGV